VTTTQPQPELAATGEIQLAISTPVGTWFDYSVRAQPHHTDYGGVVWHGSYLTWMEEARVEYLRQLGVDFANLVALGCDLPVVELSVRYHRAVRLGEAITVKTQMTDLSGVRINWDYRLELADSQELCVTARVVLVAVDREKGKILRRLPSDIETALTRQ
jgi:acyl-CoA thioester hydrolase